jgi:pimeloyl-ACP methyl ester carboxylesterase
MGAMAGVKQYEDGYWWSKDGLRLHYRDYPGRADRPPILCLPGLTRNARDFAHVAERLAGEWRVLCVELRGRGESAYAKFPMSYAPLQYLQDLDELFEAISLPKAVFFGTSLGGLLTMLTALQHPERVAGALINDIGPEIEEAGLGRIKGFVGKSASWPSWIHAARGASEVHNHAHPDYSLEQWLTLAKRLYRLTAQGRIVQDYDVKIAEPMRHPTEPFDLWPAIDALGDVPVTVLRGDLSDILSAHTAKAMAKRLKKGTLVTIPRTGHPPELDEPASIKAIDALLAKIAA